VQAFRIRVNLIVYVRSYHFIREGLTKNASALFCPRAARRQGNDDVIATLATISMARPHIGACHQSQRTPFSGDMEA
jgi:hypothetical protein